MPPLHVALLITLGVLAYVAFMGGILYWSVRSSKRHALQKSEALRKGLESIGGVRVGAGPSKGRYGPTEIEYRLEQRSVYTYSTRVSRGYDRVGIRIGGREYPAVHLYPEGAIDRFGKSIGINREVQTGDKDFDDQAYVETTDAEEHAARLLSSPDVRRELRHLLSIDYKVQFSTQGVEAFRVVAVSSDVDASKTGEAAAALARLADRLPDFPGVRFKPQRQRGWLGLPLMLPALLGAPLTIGFAIFTQRLADRSAVAVAILLFGGLCWMVYMAILAAWARGRSYGMRMVLFGGLFSMIGIPPAVGMSLVAMNELLDHGSATEHVQTVQQLRKHKSNYWAYVDSWRRPGRQEELSIPGAVYRSLAVGDRVLVRLHKGKFGWAWTERVTGKLP